jgi:hypothetical protein
MSTLSSFENTINPSDITKLIQEETIEIMQSGINIIFIWVWGHTNIEWNKITDKAAKEATLPKYHIQFLEITTYSDIKMKIQNSI